MHVKGKTYWTSEVADLTVPGAVVEAMENDVGRGLFHRMSRMLLLFQN